MQQEIIQYQKGNYQNAQFINPDHFIIDDEFNYEPSNLNQTEQYQDSDNECFQTSNLSNNKLKQINKANKKRGRGRPRKNLNSNQFENIESMDYTQMFSQPFQQLGANGKYNSYNRKFPKDHLKQNMIKLESKVLRLFHEIQSIYSNTNQFIDQTDDQVDKSFYEQYEIQKRLDWNIVSSETGYNNNSVLFKIYSFIGDQINNPSDPYGQEFISLSIENFIVTFFLDKAIEQKQYQFQDLIEDNLNHNPNLRFYQLALDDLCQILLSDISISIYSDQALAQIFQLAVDESY
ncbi:AT hook motif protein (macronuclear) [Tetrahymena thermophila SB210]|uniref:AT hook motif protein n=1 Tax=Tetrahymena thermophila (strain SB210) TaxID=312017 RepID=W7XFI5_TETTS|nr:AT hook motif protein [Tetrahymena thermophila SB210]EWS71559.1 AT hook motif protein [Tetrahymena thermophila SB210]|eukprot:XP_012655904.1 AT hook motif protein [Tetrahymena thermophila SB210]